MVHIMQIFKKHQRGPVLKLVFSLAELPASLGVGSELEEQISQIFTINDLAQVRFQCKSQSSNTVYNFSYKKQYSVPDETIKLNISCKSLQLMKECDCPEFFTEWIKMGEIQSTHSDQRSSRVRYNFWNLNRLEVTLAVFKVHTVSFAKLYEDDEFCDFHLMAGDGNASVPVHRACLALHSDMFRTMLRREWKETVTSCIKIEGVTFETLKHLKQYFYLSTLPKDTVSLQPLILLAKCYMIDNLFEACTLKMAEVVKPEEMFALQQFAVDNQLPELLKAILQYTPALTFQCAHLMADYGGAGPSGAKKPRGDGSP